MTWTHSEDYEVLLRRRHEAAAAARQARKKMSLIAQFVNDTPITQRIRADLANRAMRLERQRDAVDRELARQLVEAA